MKQLPLLILALGLLCALPVEAHRPYAIKVKTLEAPHGESLILEKLYGDGIFVADPVRLQVRNKNGVVIAHSRTASHVSEFCPSVQFCWAFPYEELFVTPMYLDFKKLKYNETSKSKIPAEPELNDYLKGTTDNIHSDNISYPDYGDKSENFLKGSPVIQLLSPLIIITDNIANFLVLAAIFFIPSFLYPIFCSLIMSKNDITKNPFARFGLGLFAAILLVPYSCFLLFTIIGILITDSTPFIYSLLIIGLSIWAGLFLSKKVWSKRFLAKPAEN